MDAFFATYTGFTPTPGTSFHESFAALAAHRGWSPTGNAHARAHRKFREALVVEFNNRFGTDDRSLANWQNMCALLGVHPVPTSITQCRKTLKRTHVNLVDLLQAQSVDDIRVFENYRALRTYTQDNQLFFPKKQAKAGGLLKALLREME
ncbi:hypothetical protein EDC01DRAFT_612641 [Geopyxis carbonaria]|nr:hypothetical protein EDC01DRAFT_612641 [Geopyxis carbonaria]